MKKIIKIILIALVISIVIIFIKDEYQKYLLNNANYGMQRLIKKKEVENLFMGSSMFRQGLDPTVLEENKIDSYILAYNGTDPSFELWILNYLLDNHVKIKNLYIDMYAYTMVNEPSISDGKIFMELNIKEKYSLYKNFNDRLDINNLWNVFVSENNEMMLSWPIYYKLINSTYVNGGVINGQEHVSKTYLEKKDMIEVDPIFNQEQVSAVKQIIKICADNHIRLIFIETPKYYRINEDKNYTELMKQYRSLLDKNSNPYYLSEDTSPDVSSDFHNYIDLIHLSNTGRKEFTERLINYIKSQ